MKKVVEGWGKEFELKASGGGTDANLHNGAGIETIVLGTGMQAVHTVDEHIHLSSMVDCLKLCLGIIEGSLSTTAS